MLVEVSKINKQEVTAVSSLDVAETFEKRHADVLRDIENLGCSTEFRERNFAFSFDVTFNSYYCFASGFYDINYCTGEILRFYYNFII